MRKPKIKWVVAVSVVAGCAGCSSDNERQTTGSSTESAETTEITQAAKPERSPSPETEEETIVRLNQLPAYEDRTEPYPHRFVEQLSSQEMFPKDIRDRYQYLFHVPIPEYIVGLRGGYSINEFGVRDSKIAFNVPLKHLDDFKRHLIEDMGVPEEALSQKHRATARHSYWDKRDMDPRENEFNESLEKTWAEAEGGLRFRFSNITQLDSELNSIAKGSPSLYFENHSDPDTFPVLKVDLQSGNVTVWERPTNPD